MIDINKIINELNDEIEDEKSAFMQQLDALGNNADPFRYVQLLASTSSIMIEDDLINGLKIHLANRLINQFHNACKHN